MLGRLRSAVHGALWLVRPELRQRLRSLDEVATRLRHLEEKSDAVASAIERAVTGERLAAAKAQREAERARWAQAGDLRAFERRVHSQNGEDGILDEIF